MEWSVERKRQKRQVGLMGVEEKEKEMAKVKRSEVNKGELDWLKTR